MSLYSTQLVRNLVVIQDTLQGAIDYTPDPTVVHEYLSDVHFLVVERIMFALEHAFGITRPFPDFPDESPAADKRRMISEVHSRLKRIREEPSVIALATHRRSAILALQVIGMTKGGRVARARNAPLPTKPEGDQHDEARRKRFVEVCEEFRLGYERAANDEHAYDMYLSIGRCLARLLHPSTAFLTEDESREALEEFKLIHHETAAGPGCPTAADIQSLGIAIRYAQKSVRAGLLKDTLIAWRCNVARWNRSGYQNAMDEWRDAVYAAGRVALDAENAPRPFGVPSQVLDLIDPSRNEEPDSTGNSETSPESDSDSDSISP